MLNKFISKLARFIFFFKNKSKFSHRFYKKGISFWHFSITEAKFTNIKIDKIEDIFKYIDAFDHYKLYLDNKHICNIRIDFRVKRYLHQNCYEVKYFVKKCKSGHQKCSDIINICKSIIRKNKLEKLYI